MKPTLLALISIACFCQAADVQEKRGELIFSDDFARQEPGEKWTIAFPNFIIRDEVLRAGQTRPEHSAVGMVKVGRKDLVIEFKFCLGGAASINAVCNDRNYKEGHGGHICRVSLSPRQIYLADDKERLRHDIEEMRKDPTRKAELKKATEGYSVRFPTILDAEHWHRLRIEIKDDEMRVILDDGVLGILKSPGIAHPTKSDFYFSVSGKEALFDDLLIFANE